MVKVRAVSTGLLPELLQFHLAWTGRRRATPTPPAHARRCPIPEPRSVTSLLATTESLGASGLTH